MNAITTTAVTSVGPGGELVLLPRPRLRDVTKVQGYMAPWAGCAFTAPQVAIGTRIPPRRVAGVLAWLVAGGWLVQGPDRWGEPTWVRVDGQRGIGHEQGPSAPGRRPASARSRPPASAG